MEILYGFCVDRKIWGLQVRERMVGNAGGGKIYYDSFPKAESACVRMLQTLNLSPEDELTDTPFFSQV